MTKSTITIAVLAVVAIIAAGLYIDAQFDDINSKIESLESSNSIDELVVEMTAERYDTCTSEAYEDYSDGWNKACWANDEDSDCRLNMFDRYQVEHDYQNDVLACVSQYK